MEDFKAKVEVGFLVFGRRIKYKIKKCIIEGMQECWHWWLQLLGRGNRDGEVCPEL